MPAKSLLHSPLNGRVIALPESRQLDILAALFERRQAQVLRIPLVSIDDAPDQAAVLAWIRAFIARPPDLLIVLTGEGLRRLRAAAGRAGLEQDLIATLARVALLYRGPKPARALREMGLQVGEQAVAPTTEGIIASLEQRQLSGLRVAVQLYGEDPNPTLMHYLKTRKLAACDTVAPYVYADAAQTERVVALIRKLAGGGVDMLAFTSKPQVRRLFRVARERQLEAALQQGLQQCLIAAVGPVVRGELEAHGCQVQVMPSGSWFMKPLVRAAEQAFAGRQD